MPTLTLTPVEPIPRSGTLVAPLPPDTWHQRVHAVDIDGAKVRGVLRANNAGQQAFVIAVEAGQTPTIRYVFDDRGPGLCAHAMTPVDSRFERVSAALLTQAQEAASVGPSAKRVARLMQFIADRFTYGDRPQLLGHETEELLALDVCDLTTGNCIDMHTVGVGALRAIGVSAAYVIGCFVEADKTNYLTGHCWINLDAGDPATPRHYDISHHVEYNLGPVTPALNPKPGQRFALGIGRGLVFDGLEGLVELPSLSGFHWIDGDTKGQKLRTIGRFGT
jgi:hypothetical protein